MVWDTAGQEEYDRLRPLSYPNTDCVVLVCSIDNPTSLDNIKNKWIKEIRHYCKGVPIVLCANKSDLYHDERIRQELGNKGLTPINAYELQNAKKELEAKIMIMTSAKQGTNVTKMFGLAAGLAEKHQNAGSRKSSCQII